MYVAGVTEEFVTDYEELLGAMSRGAESRATAATGMNEGSSRSHSVFITTVTQRNLETAATKSGKLVLVDLAGSEVRAPRASARARARALRANTPRAPRAPRAGLGAPHTDGAQNGRVGPAARGGQDDQRLALRARQRHQRPR